MEDKLEDNLNIKDIKDLEVEDIQVDEPTPGVVEKKGISMENIAACDHKSKLLDELMNVLDEKKKAFNEANEDLLKEITLVNGDLSVIKNNLKEKALIDYENTQEKKLLGGISIRCTSKLKYDVSDAVTWAKLNMPIAVKVVTSVDKKTFEEYAKKNELEFVSKEDSVSVCFPKNLKVE